MKKIIKLLPILLLVVAFSCEQDDNHGRFVNDPTSGWVEFGTSTSATTITLITESLTLPVSLRVPTYPNGIDVTYTLQAVEGDFTSIVTSTGNTVSFIGSELPGTESTPNVKNIELTFENIADLTEIVVFDVVLTAVNTSGVSIGIDDESITSYRVSTPCPIVVGTDYTASETLFNGDVGAPQGHSLVLTPVPGFDNAWTVDTIWGTGFISTLCGGCVPEPSYPGPITFVLDPITLELTVIEGGEPAGSGNPLDIGYTITGGGTYDSCNDVFIFNMEQSLLTSGGVPGTVDVTIQGN